MAAHKRSGWWIWLTVGLLAMAAGCQGEDADKLAKVGRTLRGKLQGAGGGKLSTELQAVRANLDASTLDARIAARIRWDKTLQDSKIDVRMNGTEVELHGTVADASQRQRALDLARATAGATTVTDKMEIAKPAS